MSGTTVTDIDGIGPVIAAMLIGNTADIGRFIKRDRYADAATALSRHIPRRSRTPPACTGPVAST